MSVAGSQARRASAPVLSAPSAPCLATPPGVVVGTSSKKGVLIGIRNHIPGAARRTNLSFDEALEKAIIDTKKFARKQERWFRRDPRINWIEIKQDPLEAVPILMKEYR